MTPEDFEVVVRGLTLRGLAWGDSSAPAVLALHGWLDNAASFQPLAPYVVAAGYRLLAIDLPGHGKSDHRSPDAHYHYVNYSIDVVEICNVLDLHNVTLLGHSMGAGVSLIAASGLGERVESIRIVEGLGPFTTPAEDSAETFRVAAASAARVRSRQRGIYKDVESAVARKEEALGRVSTHAARLLVQRSLRTVDEGWQFGDDPRLSGRSFIRFTEAQLHSFLEAVVCPVRLVVATDGLSYPEEAMRNRLDRLSDLQVQTVEGGHHLHMDAPQAVAKGLGLLSPPRS